MDRINKFIDDLLSERGITKNDRKDLEIEFLDHMMLLKQEYIESGYNESIYVGRLFSYIILYSKSWKYEL